MHPIVVYQGASRRILWAPDGAKFRGKEYFDKLQKSDRIKFRARFEKLGDEGVIKNPEVFRSEGDGIYAFKIFKHRLFCFMKGNDVLITHGFTKKADKVRPEELERAKRIRASYLEEHAN